VSKLKVISTPDPDFKLFEHRSQWLDGFKFYAGGTGTWSSGVISDLTVEKTKGGSDDVNYLRVGLVLEFRDAADTSVINAVGVITKVIDQQSIKVKALQSSPTNIADGDEIYVIGSAMGEGSRSPESAQTELEVVWNSCQTHKTAVEISESLRRAALRGYSNELAFLRAEAMKEHKVQIERSLLFGKRRNGQSAPANTVTDEDSKPVRTTLGAITAIRDYGTSEENYFSVTKATYDYDAFVDDMEALYQYVNMERVKYGFIGSSALAFFSKATASGGFLYNSGLKLEANPEATKQFGVDVRTLIHPFGRLELVWNPLLRGPYADTMLVVDPANIQLVQYRPTVYQTNIQENDRDGIKEQYLSDLGLGMTLIETHGLFEFK